MSTIRLVFGWMRTVNFTAYLLLISKSLWGCLMRSIRLSTKSWIDSTGKHLGRRTCNKEVR